MSATVGGKVQPTALDRGIKSIDPHPGSSLRRCQPSTRTAPSPAVTHSSMRSFPVELDLKSRSSETSIESVGTRRQTSNIS